MLQQNPRSSERKGTDGFHGRRPVAESGADPAVPSISEEQVYRWRDDLLERLEKDERAFLEDTYVRRLPVPDIMRKWNIKAPAVYQRQRRLRLKLQRMARELMENRDW